MKTLFVNTAYVLGILYLLFLILVCGGLLIAALQTLVQNAFRKGLKFQTRFTRNPRRNP